MSERAENLIPKEVADDINKMIEEARKQRNMSEEEHEGYEAYWKSEEGYVEEEE